MEHLNQTVYGLQMAFEKMDKEERHFIDLISVLLRLKLPVDDAEIVRLDEMTEKYWGFKDPNPAP